METSTAAIRVEAREKRIASFDVALALVSGVVLGFLISIGSVDVGVHVALTRAARDEVPMCVPGEAEVQAEEPAIYYAEPAPEPPPPFPFPFRKVF